MTRSISKDINVVQAAASHMDLSYDIHFSELLFELPRRGLELMEVIYSNLKSRFPISPADMQIFGGNSLSDVRVRVLLFGGNVSIETTTNQCSMVVMGIRSSDVLEEHYLGISLVENSLSKSFPNVQIDAVSIRLTIFLQLSAESETASSLISKLTRSNRQLNFTELGDVVQHPGINIELEHPQENWHIIFHTVSNRSDSSSLIVSCQSLYKVNEEFMDFRLRKASLSKIFILYLCQIGIEVDYSI